MSAPSCYSLHTYSSSHRLASHQAMKSVIFCVLVASLASEATARSHFHHFHHHIKKDVGSKSDSCDQNIMLLQAYKGPLAFEDPNSGKIDLKDALECLDTCRCKILGERVDEPMPPQPPTPAKLDTKFGENSQNSSPPLSMHETLPQAPPPLDPKSSNFGKQPPSSFSSPLSAYETPQMSQAPPMNSDGVEITLLDLSSSSLSPHGTNSAALTPYEISTPSDNQNASSPNPDAPIRDDTSNEYDAHDISSLDVEFPDGVIDCNEFPRKYGALFLDYRNRGWSGVQRISSETVDENLKSVLLKDQPISEISTPEPQECKPGCLCSYACPPGYEKTQWPQAQGMRKESLGGLYCHVDNRLYLTKPDVPTLCRRGHGGVTVFNHLSDNQAVLCRTDYPGTESMVIPTVASPRKRIDLTNPDAKETYRWQGNPTSAQYYVNPSGLQVKQVCLWKSNDKSLVTKVGNWAPIIVGIHHIDGITWPGISPNLREVEVGEEIIENANESLDYSIRITGDLAGAPCNYTKGTKVKDFKGCTVSEPELSCLTCPLPLSTT